MDCLCVLLKKANCPSEMRHIVHQRGLLMNGHIKRAVLYLPPCSWRFLGCYNKKLASRRLCRRGRQEGRQTAGRRSSLLSIRSTCSLSPSSLPEIRGSQHVDTSRGQLPLCWCWSFPGSGKSGAIMHKSCSRRQSMLLPAFEDACTFTETNGLLTISWGEGQRGSIVSKPPDLDFR